LQSKLTVLGLVLLAVMTMLGIVAFSYATPGVGLPASVLGGGNEAVDEANVEFRRALMAVREAEAAGADEVRLRILVEKLNWALRMIDRAEGLLLRGNIEGAAAEAEQSMEVSRGIVSDALRLRDESSLRTYHGKVFTFAMVPVASLLVTVGAHYGWKWWRRREIDRMMRMEISGLRESEEET